MNIETLKKVRSTVRRAATDIIKSIESEIKKEEKSVDLIDELLAKLLDKEKNLAKYDNEILNSCKTEEIEKEIEKQQEYKDNIITWTVRANKILQKGGNENKTIERMNIVENKTEHQITVKLPRLQIPQYDGNILKFNEFYSQFEVAIHQNSSLSNVEKFNYLKSYLTNEAEIAVRGLALRSENYEVALNILKERFGRKDIIIDTHMSKLLNLSPVRKSYEIASLRKLYSECEAHIRGLENNGINPNSYSCLLFPILLKAIPRDLSLEFSRRKHSKSENEISELLEFLKIEIQCRERNEHLIRDFNSSESDVRKETKFNAFEKPTQKYGKFYKNKIDYSGKNRFNSNIPNTSAFIVDVKKCIFCIEPENDHESNNCPSTIEQRKLFLRKKGMCYLCLSKGHMYKQCKTKNACKFCKRRHNDLICDSLPNSSPALIESARGPSQGESETAQSVLTSKVVGCMNTDGEILLETCSAVVIGNSKNKEINILLDNGSQRCFLKKELAVELNLPIVRQESLLVYTFGSREPIQKIYDVVQFPLCNSRDPEKRIMVEALLTDIISGAPLKVSTDKIKRMLKNNYAKLSNVSESFGSELSLLIGGQYFWEIHSGEKEKINKSLFLIDTLFGKVVQGRISPSDLNYKQSISSMKVECCAALNENLKQFWQLDSMGINDNQNDSSKFDKEFISQFESNLKFINGMYETKLFWNEKPECLDNNFAVAKRRFDNLSIKIDENNWVYKEYKNIVKDQLNSNIVEECSSDLERNSYYMPHSAVVRSDRDTTRVRLVFDASSKGKGRKSLNDCLNSGPNLNPRILDVILRFREFEYAFSSDIKGAFLTIGIAEEDRNYLRFVWFPDEIDSKSYKILRMTRVPFGVASSPFILAATIKYHIRKYKQEQGENFEMLNSALYVDDLFYGANSVDKALELSQGAVEILRDANMNLRKFKTNSGELSSLWREKGMAEERETNERPSKVLGIIWSTAEDTFKLDFQPLLDMMDDLKSTKRSVLQTASKIFDPVGFVSPFIVLIKLVMQEIWENGLGWDDELPADLKKKWENWCTQIHLLKDLTIERKYFFVPLELIKELELHIFSDASPRAFGAVAYFRYVSIDDSIHTSFIAAKSRVAPLQRLTLPRLELMGAVIASRMFQYLKTQFQFPVTKVYLWSDSLIALHWIKGTATKWKQFVSNRVSEIQSITDPADWRHCRGIDNPADYISRGATVEKLISNPVWLQGPNWLHLMKEEWPKNSFEISSDVSCEKRTKLDKVSSFVCEVQSNMTLLLDLNKFSNLKKLYRVTSWVLRFFYNTQNKNKRCEELSADELIGAEMIWIKTVQGEVYAEELSCLKQGKPISKTSSILELNPFLDKDGIMHVRGRLQKSNLAYLHKHPIILPSKHRFVNLLVRDAHSKVFHGGISETLMEIRDRYWLIKGRQTVKNILKKCVLCKRFNSSPGVQVSAPLPVTRIQESPPFSVVGIDFGGPLYAKDSDEKNYIVLFTCAVTRALHLEFVGNLTTETFLLALRRFIARRGLCSQILTDNAKTFKRAELEIKNLWTVISHPTVKDYYASHKIQWCYIAEKAAWWGGFYERLIKSVKLALRKTLRKTTLSRDELETLIIEIESVLNSRPLTYVFSDLQEPVPLTPAHMLLGRRVNSLPPARLNFNSNLVNRKILIIRFNYRERLSNLFWNKWKKEYLLLLRSVHCVKPTGKVNEFKINDIVLIHDEKLPRHFWKLGRVVTVFPGRDGKIRSCEIKTDTSVIRRPVQLLYNLEVNE